MNESKAFDSLLYLLKLYHNAEKGFNQWYMKALMRLDDGDLKSHEYDSVKESIDTSYLNYKRKNSELYFSHSREIIEPFKKSNV